MIPLRGILLTARHAARTCLRGKRLLALLTLVALAPVLTAAIRVLDSAIMSAGGFHGMVLMLTFQFVIPFSALLLGVGVLGDELEGRTITYLWTRPVGRGWLYLGRYLGFGVAYAFLFVPAMAIALHLRAPAAELAGVSLWRPIGIGLGGFFAYLALFSLLRTLLKRALVVGMFYILTVDMAIAKFPGVGAAKLSIWHHLVVIHSDAFEPGQTKLLATFARTIGAGENAGVSTMVLLVGGITALVLGMWIVRTREYPVAGAVA